MGTDLRTVWPTQWTLEGAAIRDSSAPCMLCAMALASPPPPKCQHHAIVSIACLSPRFQKAGHKAGSGGAVEIETGWFFDCLYYMYTIYAQVDGPQSHFGTI